MTNIGILNEQPLHAALKAWYAQPGDQVEVAVKGFVIDLVRDDLLLEIQTSNFAAIKVKLLKLVQAHRIRVIYPIAQEKWIIKLAKHHCEEMTIRKSPKRGQIEDVFCELVRFPQLLAHPNFSLEVVLIRAEEVRRYDGRRPWRRHGWVIEEHRLRDVVGRKVFATPLDWQALLPDTLPAAFTTNELADALHIRRPLAQKMAYCLCQGQVIRLLGKRGRAKSYGVAVPEEHDV
jgi:hypothetical protein